MAGEYAGVGEAIGLPFIFGVSLLCWDKPRDRREALIIGLDHALQNRMAALIGEEH